MNTVTITRDEAMRALNVLRSLQMNLSAITRLADDADAGVDLYLASPEFAGELNQLINGLEGSIWESGMIEMPGGQPQSGGAAAALDEFQRILTRAERASEEDVTTLVTLARMAEREELRANAGTEPSQN